MKDYLKKISAISWLNGKIKSLLLKNNLKRISNQFYSKAKSQNYEYNKLDAINEFKKRIFFRNSNFKKKQIGELKVLWIGANESQDFSGFIQGMKRICDLVEFKNSHNSYGIWYGDENSTTEEIRMSNDQDLINQLTYELDNNGIDVVMGQMWANYISNKSLEWARKKGIVIINVSMDDRLPEHWQVKGGIKLGAIGLSGSTDMVLTTSSETCGWYGVNGCPAIYWPLASDPEVFKPRNNAPRDIDVLFIGNKYGYRTKVIKGLKKAGINVSCYGKGWNNGPVMSKEMASLFKRAKIMLGIGTIGHCEDVYTLKLRDFDAPMSGALYITHRNPDLLEMFKEGKDIECYETINEASTKIKFYLNNPENLKKIAYSGSKLAAKRDTWDKRLTDTFQMLELIR
tara:strand:- start:1773 stop:2972 length:1200 start_codon:yes stop_codon:yes gene_type:complete